MPLDLFAKIDAKIFARGIPADCLTESLEPKSSPERGSCSVWLPPGLCFYPKLLHHSHMLLLTHNSIVPSCHVEFRREISLLSPSTLTSTLFRSLDPASCSR